MKTCGWCYGHGGDDEKPCPDCGELPTDNNLRTALEACPHFTKQDQRDLFVLAFLAGAEWHERQQIEETKASWRALTPANAKWRAGRGGRT